MLEENDEIVDPLETENEEPQGEKPVALSPKEILKKYNLDTRWKPDDPIELVDEMGKSYVNAEKALRERESEGEQLRQIIRQQQNMLQQQQQPYPANQKQETELDPEVERARKFIRNEVSPILQEQLMPLQQQNAQLQAKLYVLERINDSSQIEFKKAVESGELKREMEMNNLPFQADAMDYAFNKLMYRKTQEFLSQSREEAKDDGAAQERAKQKAFLENGGKSGKPAVLSAEDIVSATRHMSEKEFDDYCKKNGIRLPT